MKENERTPIEIVVLRYTIPSEIGSTVNNTLGNEYEYIYNPKNEYVSIVKDIFKDSRSKDIVLLGYSVSEHKYNEAWIGRARLFKGEKIIVDSAFKVKTENLEALLMDFEHIPENRDFRTDQKYVTVRTIHYEDYGKHSKLNYRYPKDNPGVYANLKNEHIDSFVSKREEHLSAIAQRSIYARRPLGFREPQVYRGEFQRDRERIVHCKAYRRLVDKAQIYTSSKGDHYRTRLTHTLEVNQIARAVAIALYANEDLTEAIALGHDLGHTPFGHEGERILHEIMSGKYPIHKDHETINFGGFKHNYQSIRIANYLEEKYIKHEGLDLTYQVLEGILKHTKFKKCKKDNQKCNECLEVCFDISDFLINGDEEYLHLDFDYPTSIEGQIVVWADEIAQRGHDLDDGLASGVIKIDELIKSMEINGLSELAQFIKSIHDSIEDEMNDRNYIDKDDLLRASLVPQVIDYFTSNLITQSSKNIKAYIQKNGGLSEFEKNPLVKEFVVSFEEKHKTQLEELEKIITQKVINSQEVNCFDGKSAYVIKKLFKAYFYNPKQLPDSAVSRIYRDIRKHTPNCVNIRTGNKDSVKEEIEIMQGQRDFVDSSEARFKQKVFMRAIADHIGGMTDEYANEQYKRLYFND